MVKNQFFKCKICGTPIRLRYQVGYFNILVNDYCPVCNTHLSGEIFINQDKPEIISKLKNLIEQDDSFEDGFTLELSTEFFQKKASKNEGKVADLSPFMRSSLSSFSNLEKAQRLLSFSSNKNFVSEEIINIFNLLVNKQYGLLMQYMNTEKNQWLELIRKDIKIFDIKTESDALMPSHHYIAAMIRTSMTEKTQVSFENVMKLVSDQFRLKPKETRYFLKFLDKSGYFTKFYNALPNILSKYISHYREMLPVMIEYENFDKMDLTQYGITTASVENMCSLYSNGYEFLCDYIDIIIGLINIDKRSEYDNFKNGRTNFLNRINSYISKYRKYNDTMDSSSILSNDFIGLLDNDIRNSIAHNGVEVNGRDQVIFFSHKYKGVISTKKFYIAEFAYQCIKLYSGIIILWEFYYQMYKNKLILIDNMIPSYLISKKNFL